MPQNPVLKETTFQNETSAARQHWASGPPGTQTPEGPTTGFATMTVGGTAIATGILIMLVALAGVFGWSQVVPPTVSIGFNGQPVYGAVTFPPWLFAAGLIGFVFALISSFKPKLARFTGPIYAVTYGSLVGAISHLYDIQTSGIVIQAVAATMSVAVVMWVLYTTRILKVTERFRAVVMGATLGIMVLYLGAFIFSLFGANIRFWNEPSPLGIGISVVIVGIAALNLAVDFDFVDRATDAGAPKYMEWYAAFGITVTLVWLYLEMLRLLSLINRN